MADGGDVELGTIDQAGQLVLGLRQVGKGDLERAGGKGANLGELLRAGFPVPPGFVVTTAAYELLLERSGVARGPAGSPELGADDQPDAGAVRAALLAAPVPPQVADAVGAAYRALGAGPVAVRSSATAEDLPGATFAGQQDTFLNVEGEPAVLEAVRACCASLWGERAVAYRRRQGLDPAAARIAVVVQRLVPAEVAGVLFTANPVSGARDELVVDANPGLGEAVVSGLVTPDHYVLAKRSGRVREWRPGRREVIIGARPGGGTEQRRGTASDGRPVLPRPALRRLAKLGRAIERHFGRPQDVEWAWSAGKLFALQARPMTALPDAPPAPRRLSRMMLLAAGEVFPIRPYPLDATTWLPAILVGGVGAMVAPLGITAPSTRHLLIEEDGVVVGLVGNPGVRPTVATLRAPATLLRLARRYNPAAWRADPLLTKAQTRTRALERRDLAALSWSELLATAREALTVPLLVGELRRRYFPRAVLAGGALWLLLRALGRQGRFAALLSGVETETLAANRALEALAARVRADPALAATFATHAPPELLPMLNGHAAGREILAALDAFLDRYGHRETTISLVSQPTWKDAPEVVLGLLKGLAAAEPRPAARRPAWELERDEILARPLFRLPPARSAFLALLAATRRFWQVREDTHFYLTLPLPALRRTLLELGRRLAAVGVLDSAEDVFHLRLGELERVDEAWPPRPGLAEELRALAGRRKDKRLALADRPLLARRRSSPVTEGEALLRGTPGSPGLAEGPVRVVHDGAEFGTLLPGEVLVAPYTNPAWTPLFQRAAAVVVDSGGAASHAAIVAREYAIPAVMGTGDGTQRLGDGQRVRVDGDRGLVLPAGPTEG